MRKPINLLLALLLLSGAALSQSTSIKGLVMDTSEKRSLANAVITALRKSDSVLLAYTRSGEKGDFQLTHLPPGEILLQVSYPKFASYVDVLTPEAGKQLDLGAINLIRRSQLLQEVIVSQKIAAIRFKGDTLEFKADSFKVSSTATVEDLLKKLPGLQVNSKGEITAQGQKVQKVLVDGEEFFGDDPTLATQNLNAKSVDKVQVFDKKSDEATITGVDDGKKTKTVNLILKDDAKKGYFGRIEGGSDFDHYFQGKATANTFKGSRKAGFYLNANRTGQNNMNWDEMRDFGTGYTSGVDENGGMFVMINNEDDNRNAEGIPTNVNGALMYANKFGILKSSTNDNYNYKYQASSGDGSTQSQYILPDTVYYTNQNRHVEQTRWGHTFRTKNEWNLDSATTINLNLAYDFNRRNASSHFLSQTLSAEKSPVNDGDRTLSTLTDNRALNTELFFRRKLSKKGRLVSLALTDKYTDLNENGYLYNQSNFYQNGLVDSTAITDQKKTRANLNRVFSGRISYTEPLSKRWALVFNYSYASGDNTQDSRSYEKTGLKYDSLNRLYSNNFRFNSLSNQGNLVLRYNSTKAGFSVGAGVQDLSLQEKNLFNDSAFRRNFTNFIPTASFRYKLGTSGFLGINYNGQQQAPSLQQIQPIIDNNDQFNIVVGNPNLRPSFEHHINFNFGDFKEITGRNFFMWANINLTQNGFSSKDHVDNNGVKTTQAVNVDGNYNGSVNMDYNIRIKKLGDLNLSFGPNLNFSRNISFISLSLATDAVRNVTQSSTFGFRVGINKFKEKKYDFYVGYTPAFSYSASSIRTDVKTRYWVQSIDMYSSLYLGKNLQLITNVNANYRQKTDAFPTNTNAFIWNMSAEQKIMKKKDLYLIFGVNDILDQNIGFSRNVSTNFITENTFATVKRFWLLSLRYKFNKNGKSPSEN